MRLKNLTLYLVLFLSFNLLASCDDDDDGQPDPSRTELIASGEWKGDRVLLNSIDVASIPGIGDNAGTFQTLRFTIRTDNTYTAVFQAEGKEHTYEGGWEFNNDESSIIMENIGELDIKRLTTDNLDLTTTVSVENLNLLGEIIGVDERLIQAFTGGNPVDAEMRFVK